MTHLHELAIQLLIGTDRRAPDWPSPAGELGRLVNQLASAQDAPEIRALRIAGTFAVCAEAGFLPTRTEHPPLPSCPPETHKPVTDPTLIATLQAVLDEGPDALRAEALRRLSEAGRALPSRLLPRALTLGVRHAWLRALLTEVVDARGRWLARINPDWSSALVSDVNRLDPSGWDEGTLEQRCQFLAARRHQDPDEARQRLVETFDESDARARARLLAILEVGLSNDDEGVLNDCLKDRSKEVRQQAAALLARLPDSQYVARMAKRVCACLTQHRGMLRTKLGIEPPETFDPDWRKDGIEEAHLRGDALGPRAWWLYQMVRALPLRWWNAQTGLDAEECVRWSTGTDWDLALLRAWIEALGRAPTSDWAAALLARLPIKDLNVDPFDLIASLPPAEREHAWLRQIEGSKHSLTLGASLARMTQTLSREGAQLSAPTARTLLVHITQRLASGRLSGDDVLRRSLPDLICCLPPDTLPEVAHDWPMERPELRRFADTLAQVLAVIKHRQTLIQQLQEARSS